MIINLAGKNAIVTGGSRGLGSGIVRSLASAGANVAINFNKASDRAEQMAREVQEFGVKAMTVQADLTIAEEAERMIREVSADFGSLDILVNNAGRNWVTSIMDMTVEDWDRTIALNLRAHFLTSKAVLPGMMEKGWGRIIGITSISGQRGGFSGDVDYSAAKAGIMGFTRCLARLVATDGITVNAVAPGYFATEHTKIVPSALLQQLIDNVPIKRMGTLDECGAVVAFLASDAASYITGEVMSVNGGAQIA
ncbi:MAG: 3-oxoacyl-ACP reductase family protein [Anaerolineales bacterium]